MISSHFKRPMRILKNALDLFRQHPAALLILFLFHATMKYVKNDDEE